MQAISPFVIFAVFDVQVLKCCRSQVYKLMFCTFIFVSIRYQIGLLVYFYLSSNTCIEQSAKASLFYTA